MSEPTQPAEAPMPTAEAPAPLRCGVLVVGAGPAGAACARWLARSGIDVLLVDRHDFPRDKICGDGLIPDAHRALARLGLLDEVMQQAHHAAHIACIAPRGGRVDVPGALSVLPRLKLDDILVRGARAAGARWRAPWKLESIETDGDVVRAQGQGPAGPQAIEARWLVLATGAAAPPLQASGLCERHTPSGIALRGYVHHPAMHERIRALEVVWHPKLARGYGWIFPAPGGRFNVGVGLAQSHAQDAEGHGSMQAVNLRELLQTFCDVHPAARALVEGGRWDGPVKGAPLRCSLTGARPARPGVLAVGEAVGSTYAFTGEGIGKAMETGILAAEALVEAQAARGAAADAGVCGRYAASIAALQPRFELYERAQRINGHPWMMDLVVWRARHSERILRRMANVLDETSNPGNVVSARGMLRLVLPLR